MNVPDWAVAPQPFSRLKTYLVPEELIIGDAKPYVCTLPCAYENVAGICEHVSVLPSAVSAVWPLFCEEQTPLLTS